MHTVFVSRRVLWNVLGIVSVLLVLVSAVASLYNTHVNDAAARTQMVKMPFNVEVYYQGHISFLPGLASMTLLESQSRKMLANFMYRDFGQPGDAIVQLVGAECGYTGSATRSEERWKYQEIRLIIWFERANFQCKKIEVRKISAGDNAQRAELVLDEIAGLYDEAKKEAWNVAWHGEDENGEYTIQVGHVRTGGPFVCNTKISSINKYTEEGTDGMISCTSL